MEYFFYIQPYEDNPQNQLTQRLQQLGFSAGGGRDYDYFREIVKVSLVSPAKGVLRVSLPQQDKMELDLLIREFKPQKVLTADSQPINMPIPLENQL